MPYKAETVPVFRPVAWCLMKVLSQWRLCEIKLFLKVHNNEIFRMFVDRFYFDRKNVDVGLEIERQAAEKNST